jgi:Tfp pilus assembly protein PilZ
LIRTDRNRRIQPEKEKMHTDVERRESERIVYESAILHSTIPPDFLYKGTMYNFSHGGLYFESNEDLLEGDKISLSINKPPKQFRRSTRHYFDVKIMWCKKLQGSAYQVGYGAKLI